MEPRDRVSSRPQSKPCVRGAESRTKSGARVSSIVLLFCCLLALYLSLYSAGGYCLRQAAHSRAGRLQEHNWSLPLVPFSGENRKLQSTHDPSHGHLSQGSVCVVVGDLPWSGIRAGFCRTGRTQPLALSDYTTLSHLLAVDMQICNTAKPVDRRLSRRIIT